MLKNHDLLELINHYSLEVISFIDTEKQELVVNEYNELAEDELDAAKNLLRLPYEEELIDENAVLGDYILERELYIPKRMSARRYLRREGLYYDFLEYKNEELAKALLEWLKDQHIKIGSVA